MGAGGGTKSLECLVSDGYMAHIELEYKQVSE
jgi:hypothetical protein